MEAFVFSTGLPLVLVALFLLLVTAVAFVFWAVLAWATTGKRLSESDRAKVVDRLYGSRRTMLVGVAFVGSSGIVLAYSVSSLAMIGSVSDSGMIAIGIMSIIMILGDVVWGAVLVLWIRGAASQIPWVIKSVRARRAYNKTLRAASKALDVAKANDAAHNKASA